jgi:hypothetical protein
LLACETVSKTGAATQQFRSDARYSAAGFIFNSADRSSCRELDNEPLARSRANIAGFNIIVIVIGGSPRNSVEPPRVF